MDLFDSGYSLFLSLLQLLLKLLPIKFHLFLLIFIDTQVCLLILWLTLSFRNPHHSLLLFNIPNRWLILLWHKSGPIRFKYWMISISLSAKASASTGMLDTVCTAILLASASLFIKDFILLYRKSLFLGRRADGGKGLFWMIEYILRLMVKIEMVGDFGELLWWQILEYIGLKDAVSPFLLAWSTIHLIIYLIN